MSKDKDSKHLHLARACRQVFGVDGQRTPAQEVVWDELFKARQDGPVYVRNERGGYDETEAKLNDGARRMVMQVGDLLRFGIDKEKPETKVIKK